MQYKVPRSGVLVVAEAQPAFLILGSHSLLVEGVYTHYNYAHTPNAGYVNIMHCGHHIEIFEHSEHKEHHHNIAQTDSYNERNSALKTMLYTTLYEAKESRPKAKEERERNAAEYTY